VFDAASLVLIRIQVHALSVKKLYLAFLHEGVGDAAKKTYLSREYSAVFCSLFC
jgi:hypothetical protein